MTDNGRKKPRSRWLKHLGQRLWWMDREDPRFRDSFWAKVGFSVVWAVGFLFLLLFSQFVISLLVRFGFIGRTGS